jgi:hypothetical protein
MAQRYGTAIVPARPRKPKDKAKVEGGVLIAQRWILACLRNRRFFTLEELNAAIGELLEKLNTRPFQKLEGCRRSAFEKLDRPAMGPLPVHRYEIGAWKLGVGVNVDHHFEYDHRHYSVPSELIGAKVVARTQLRPEGDGGHEGGASSAVASRVGGLAAGAAGGLGADEGREDRRGSGGDPRTRTAPGVGATGVLGADANGRALRERTA